METLGHSVFAVWKQRVMPEHEADNTPSRLAPKATPANSAAVSKGPSNSAPSRGPSVQVHGPVQDMSLLNPNSW